ncbi:MAG: fumarate reductase (CoM/CoB) subunit [Clostridia bacterium]|nr:fumarate reductase (CoM/CoB) subunit [Clostridia bacterium]
MHILKTDVLIVGAGGAGLRAAIEAARGGAAVLVVQKASGNATQMAGGLQAVAFGHADPRDNPEQHYADTMAAGCWLNNPKLVKVLVEEAPRRLLELEEMGVEFYKQDGKFQQLLAGGHTYRRNCIYKGSNTRQLMQVLKVKAAEAGAEFLKNTVVARIVLYGGHVAGALAVDALSGELRLLSCRSLILATGGGGGLYARRTTPPGIMGDGYALAYAAGAELIDMEFVQFMPTVLVYPPRLNGKPVNETIRGEGAYLLNSTGERFMARWDPRKMEVATRDVVARAIFSEIQAGRGTPHGGAYLDARHIPEAVLQKSLTHYHSLLKYGCNPAQNLLEVAPAAHFFCGGVRIDADGATSIPGLFAAGEVAGGVHGANRLGGNALSETQVFGARAGSAAARWARESGGEGNNKAGDETLREAGRQFLNDYTFRGSCFLDREGKGITQLQSLKNRLRRTVEASAGILRSEEGLRQGLAEIEACRGALADLRSGISRRALANAVELDHMLTTAEILLRAALQRRESRGAHFRQDYPELDDDRWRKNIVFAANLK